MTINPARDFYDRISHAYDLIADGGEHVARQRGLELLDVSEGESVLEIGFGTGHSLVSLADSVGTTGQVTGIDISSGMRDVSLKRLQESNCADRVKLIVAETPPLPLDDDTFDVVSMSFTLELFALENIPAVLAECKRVLKPGGRIGIVSMATVAEGDSKSTLERTYIWMHTHFPHIVDCQPIPLESMVEQAGLVIAKQERIDLFTMPVSIVVATA
ncbi:Demethylmenaquinone methyltransferase [Rubripirellula lacrimiformis]|uniref:Demethylmenaquinone methyltransferase n=1 Tax=Rubripirellula lacrimiformis TaxID=1930273 RepID=A0A517NF07_9BACT|nr:methyltransferase domain-containing protein [Rubripirellula lacrimiformis]QDT05717.1 Demethylmenaquinone methyltransferase [Rubripirellula lacrimiformis]